MHCTYENTVAVILAGGESQRMDGIDKPFAPLNNRPLIDYTLDTLKPHIKHIIISRNSNNKRFSVLNLPLVQDTIQPPKGPLGGILTTMQYIKTQPYTAKWLLSVPVDCPFLPQNWITQLIRYAHSNRSANVMYSSYKNDNHYLCSLWSLDVDEALSQHLKGNNHSVRSFLNHINAHKVLFQDEKYNPFFNINTVQDLREAQTIMNTNKTNNNMHANDET